MQGKQGLLVSILCSISYLHWDETTPQRRKSISLYGLDSTIDQTIINLFVGWLTHEIGSNSIKGRYGARHKKPGNETGGKGGSDVLSGPSSGFGNISLGQIVDSHFGGIQHACSHNVGFDTAIKSGNALIPVHVLHHVRQRDSCICVGLGQSLNHFLSIRVVHTIEFIFLHFVVSTHREHIRYDFSIEFF